MKSKYSKMGYRFLSPLFNSETGFRSTPRHMNITNITDGLVQNCSISTADALEILQSCTEPSIQSTERGVGKVDKLGEPFDITGLCHHDNYRQCVTYTWPFTYHGKVFILMKFLSLAATKVVSSDENFVKMMPFPFQFFSNSIFQSFFIAMWSHRW